MADAVITDWAVNSECPMLKTYDCTDAADNAVLILGRPNWVALAKKNAGNAANILGELEGSEDAYGVTVSEDGIEEVTGWSVIQAALEALGVDFTAVQDDIDAHLAALAYAPEPTQAWTTSGVSEDLLASMA